MIVVPHAQRHVAPTRPAAVQIRPVDEVADADDRTEPVVGETLQMVDEILAREVLLGHRAVHIVLVSDVAVEIDLGRHDRLARQGDARRAGRDLQIALAADPCEPVVLDDECGVLDRGAAIAGDQPGSFEYRDAGRSGLSVHAPGRDHRREATADDE